MAIIATVGSASANSYVTLAEAETYMDGRVYTDDWDNASDTDKEKALISATLRLEQESWRGAPSATTQALKWPRYNVENADYEDAGHGSYPWGWGYYLDSTTIPVWLKNAQCELALVLLGTNLLEDTGLELIESVSVGDLNVTPHKSRKAGRLPANVRRFVAPYIVGGGGTVRLVRS